MFLDKYIDGGWVLAIRPRTPGSELFLGHTQRPFKLIRNPWRYWCADPFLITHGGKRYIFCEAFDIFKDRGILAYRTIDEKGRVGKLRPCLDTGSHLSYPNVFCHDGKMYMIPESGAAEEVAIYEAQDFPRQWEKKVVLLHGTAACDSNLLTCQGSTYLLTLVFDKTRPAYVYDKLFIYQWDGARFVLPRPEPAVLGAHHARNAGNCFTHDGKLYRVSQDCAQMYGERITFHEIIRPDPQDYEEKAVCRVSVTDVQVDSSKNYDGIHTYNADDTFEIIDLQRKKWFRMERLIYLIGYKLCRIFRCGR